MLRCRCRSVGAWRLLLLENCKHVGRHECRLLLRRRLVILLLLLVLRLRVVLLWPVVHARCVAGLRRTGE